VYETLEGKRFRLQSNSDTKHASKGFYASDRTPGTQRLGASCLIGQNDGMSFTILIYLLKIKFGINFQLEKSGYRREAETTTAESASTQRDRRNWARIAFH
jgi:hypothetical protein